MPDSPDWYGYQLAGARHNLTDAAELAARLGSTDVYDRRGQVIWIDSGRNGLSPWIVAVSGTGAFVKVLASPTYAGPYCLELRTGSDGGLVARITHQFAPAEINLWGLETAVNFATEFDAFRVELARFDGVNAHYAFVQVNRTAGYLQIRLPDGSYQNIAALTNPVDLFGIYHQIKVVADFDADQYVRLLYNENEYDISAYGLRVEAATDIAQQRATFRHLGRSGQNDKAFIGNAIITVGEA